MLATTKNNDSIDEKIFSLVNNSSTKEKGFRLLMTTYQERLYWHIRRMVAVHEDTDDVLQNTFVKVYRNLDSFEGKSKLYTWLYRIATNESLTFLKKRKRYYVSEQLDTETNSIASRLEADPYWDGDKAALILEMALDVLPEKQKAVFNMKYHDDLSYQQISEILGTSQGGLKASYHHAVKKIEAYIKLHSENLLQ